MNALRGAERKIARAAICSRLPLRTILARYARSKVELMRDGETALSMSVLPGRNPISEEKGKE